MGVFLMLKEILFRVVFYALFSSFLRPSFLKLPFNFFENQKPNKGLNFTFDFVPNL